MIKCMDNEDRICFRGEGGCAGRFKGIDKDGNVEEGCGKHKCKISEGELTFKEDKDEPTKINK